MKKTTLVLVALFTTFLPPLTSSAQASGTTSAEFLKMGVGGRAEAMGQAQTAIADDAFALYWNPAALGAARSPEVSFMQNRLYEDLQQQSAALALPSKSAGTFAVGAQRLAMDDYQGFDAQGSPTGALASGALGLTGAWGKNLVGGASAGSGLFGGLALSALSEKHANVSGSGFAADIGFLWRPSPITDGMAWAKRVSFGLAAKHLGQGPKFDKDTASLPTEFAGGLGYTHFLSGDTLTLGLDLRQTTGEDMSASAGLEYWLRNIIALRAGYIANAPSGEGIRAGAGFHLGRLQLDYAWAGYGDDLGATHRLSAGWRFGGGEAAMNPGLAGDLFNHHLEQGKKYMALGVYDLAVLNFNQAQRIRPQDADTQKLLMECGKKLKEMPQ